MTPVLELGGLSIALFVAFLFLGKFVSTRPLTRIDIDAGNVRGAFTRWALLFTRSGRALPLLAIGILATLEFYALKRPLWIPLGISASQLLSQGFVELLKRHFVRERPDDWLARRERGLSYPSGHATTAIVFFGGWLLALADVPMPPAIRLVAGAALAAWMIGIGWSRMALGAHYLTDVLGGALFGSAWMCAILAMLLRLRAIA